MKKIVVNDGTAGYGLSQKAYEHMGLDWEKEVVWPLERGVPGITKTLPVIAGMAFQNDRTNPLLVECVETLGEQAGIPGTFFIICEIEDDREYEIFPKELGGEIMIHFPKGE